MFHHNQDLKGRSPETECNLSSRDSEPYDTSGCHLQNFVSCKCFVAVVLITIFAFPVQFMSNEFHRFIHERVWTMSNSGKYFYTDEALATSAV